VQQQGTDLSVAHQKAIDYYLLHFKQRPWQTIDDVTEYLETFYHHCELKQYAQSFDTIYDSSSNDDCNNFLNLGGYNAIRVQLYSQLVQKWQPSNEDERWKFCASLTSLGIAYDSQGEYNKAIEYHQQSLVIKQEIGDRSGIAKSFNNLGNAYDSLGEYNKAIEYHQQSLKIFQEIGDRSGIATSLGNLGNAYDSLGEYQQAIE
jgi:tetratricopeptide (TPR) repeat protein